MAAGLARLPAQQRQLLTLRCYSDLTVRSIAEVMGIPKARSKAFYGLLQPSAYGCTRTAHATQRDEGDPR
ncbi:sigma factor-like helix-turn-helix DNA-binding protein [Streptomyces sp. ITFR-6]|uniref:sigma factor-like helix-turn-helix DNA-binding protein n=1 Tax=Streptomyces sp. ITFR-6 TaxID=3075197 RepID=UPI00288A957E|nr:sigma factor-like helix-turn-helix DNA-binding protein [Streptomyces sp. ITFR-6]WNI33889.1 sigma factor-like helix-turn-helix DNA-binding protein [Streptomyces sp. ITFR-6]